jgi:hypothetical protein
VACDDGADNDGDGLIDWPADADCTSAIGDSEAPVTAVPMLPPIGAVLLPIALIAAGVLETRRSRRTCL